MVFAVPLIFALALFKRLENFLKQCNQVQRSLCPIIPFTYPFYVKWDDLAHPCQVFQWFQVMIECRQSEMGLKNFLNIFCFVRFANILAGDLEKLSN